MSVAIVAYGAVSALGEGSRAVHAGEPGEPARVVLARDDALARAGLARPFAARAAAPGSTDPAAEVLRRASASCVAGLDADLPGWRTKRVGLAVGTSSGGLAGAEPLFATLRDAGPAPAASTEDAFYFAPMVRAARDIGVAFSPATLILAACAASTVAVGMGKRWLEAGLCDVVLAGGFDAVSTLVAAGFEVLRATTGEIPPRPFRAGRDGMALGEGAALVALVRSPEAPRARVHVTGFGASSDAVHLTAPDRTGAGLARAAERALAEAGRPRVDLVSAHGTATPYSDAAEARALEAALGVDAARSVVVHPFKAQIGHTLGAAGALEALACADAITRGVLPAAAGAGPIDPDTPLRLLPVTERGAPRTGLKLSAAFGGANAAVVLSAAPWAIAARAREVYVSRATFVGEEPSAAGLAAELGQPIEKTAKADALTRFALAAVGKLEKQTGPLRGAGVVVGEAFATLETDAVFSARIAERGARMAEPRRFPYTSPNAAPGECGVFFGLTGPGFAVGAGLAAALEALVLAADLVRAGDAERVVVVGADAVGPAVRAIGRALGIAPASGAVALLVSAERGEGAYVLTRGALRLGPEVVRPSTPVGHEALLPLTSDASRPRVLSAGGHAPFALFAEVELAPNH